MLKKLLRVPIGKFPRDARTLLRKKFFIIKTSSNTLGYSRVGIIIKKKGIRNSVKRNSIKRSIFKVFEGYPEILNKSGVDYVIIVSGGRELDGAANGELTKELEDSIKEIINAN